MPQMSDRHSWPKSKLPWRDNIPVPSGAACPWEPKGIPPNRRTEDKKACENLNTETWRKLKLGNTLAAEDTRPVIHERKSEPDVSKLANWRQPEKIIAKKVPLSTATATALPATSSSYTAPTKDAKRTPCSKVSAGQIVWLPVHEQIQKQSVVHLWDAHRETYGHPAIVVRVNSKDRVEIRTISSLNNTPLGEKGGAFQSEENLRAHLLIQHPLNYRGSWNNPNGADNLKIRDGKCLAGPCYVRLDKKLLIETDQLTEYEFTATENDRIALDEKSTQTLQHFAKLTEAIYNDRSKSFDSAKAGVANVLRQDDLVELANKQSRKIPKHGSDNEDTAEDDRTAAKTVSERRSDPCILAPKIAILRQKPSLP